MGSAGVYSPRCDKVVDVVVEIPHFAPTPLVILWDLNDQETPAVKIEVLGHLQPYVGPGRHWSKHVEVENIYLLQGKLGRSIYYAHLTDSPARRSPEQKN